MWQNLLGMKGHGTPVDASQIIESLEVGSGKACNFNEIEDDYNWESTGLSCCALTMSWKLIGGQLSQWIAPKCEHGSVKELCFPLMCRMFIVNRKMYSRWQICLGI